MIPVTSSDSLFVPHLEDPLGLIETATTTVLTTPMDCKLQYLSSKKNKTSYLDGQKNNLNDKNFDSETDTDSICSNAEVLLSSLDDSWNIGSEVSISQNLDSPLKDKAKINKPHKKLSKNAKMFNIQSKSIKNDKSLKRKKKIPKKDKFLTKTVSHSDKKKKKDIDLVLSEVEIVSEPQVLEGQLVHISKENDESSDVNIDISDEEQLMIDEDPISIQPQCSEVSNNSVINEENSSTLENTNNTSSNKQLIFNFPVPIEEITIDLDKISDEEKSVHYEYFEGKGVKTPERYLKIRNYLINFWKQTKPKYVRKTAARNGLKSCGDVNSIGKVHEYLEKIGAINFGCAETDYSSPLVIGNKPKEKVVNSLVKSKRVDRSDVVRNKQKVKFDVALSEGGGVTISHDEFGAVIDACHISEPPKHRQNENKNNKVGLFKLNPCLRYDPDVSPPFSVVIHSYALVTFDIHSHTSYGEVMGLLGGYHDPLAKKVHVTIAVPTKSSSSGIECDMCPISQNAACIKIHESGVQVVGWYHSHPTFPPNPSVQDIETQTQMQEWFAKQGAPFLGIIISPFCPTNVNESSHIRCLVLDKPSSADLTNNDQKTSQLFPYRLQWKVTEEISGEWDDIGRSIRTVADMGRENSLAIDWRQEWKPLITYWEKALKSLSLHLPSHSGMQEFTNVVRKYFLLAIKGTKD